MGARRRLIKTAENLNRQMLKRDLSFTPFKKGRLKRFKEISSMLDTLSIQQEVTSMLHELETNTEKEN